MKEYCFARDAAFNELDDWHELEAGCSLFEKVRIVPGNPPCITRSARGQAHSAPIAVLENGIENIVSFKSNVKTLGVDSHTSCSDIVLSY